MVPVGYRGYRATRHVASHRSTLRWLHRYPDWQLQRTRPCAEASRRTSLRVLTAAPSHLEWHHTVVAYSSLGAPPLFLAVALHDGAMAAG